MKFKQILNVKKQALQNAELDLNKAKLRKKSVENELELVKNEINKLKEPTTLNEMVLVNDFIQVNLIKQSQLKEKLSLCDKEISHYNHLYKRASLDYEKIKYLYEEELKQKKKALEKKQALELDEIATMRFFANSQSNN